MTDKKLTESEIVKLLECCKKSQCSNCEYSKKCDGYTQVNYALDLITRQKTENENLKVENQSLRSAANSLKMHYEEAQAEIERLQYLLDEEEKKYTICAKHFYKEAIKEFAERLCEDRVSNDPVVIAAKCLLKEMVGDDNA